MELSVATAIRNALLTAEPFEKAKAARAVARDWRAGRLEFLFDVPMPDQPAWPRRPELLPANQMPKRGKGGSERARTALWHALAHIEFVAIDLALDMAGRFGEAMGESFLSDFLPVAADEAMHFVLLARRLRSMGACYGELPAHAGLWQAAEETKGDVSARLAIVPMLLEARGLDVTPATLKRLKEQGDERGRAILQRILDDEIRHVGIGTKHFVEQCRTRSVRPEQQWQSLVRRHFRGSVRPPFNDSARLAAGLSREFYAAIAS